MPAATAPASRAAIDWAFPALGSRWRIHHGGRVDGEAAQATADLVRADERRWSRFIPSSDVARATAAAGEPVAVARETIDLLEEAVRWQEASAGRFDPLVGRALAATGYGDPSGGGGAGPSTGGLVVDRGAGTVHVPAGERLDLGGIGKSWVARRAAALLVQLSDDERIVVDAGGDIHVERGDEIVGTPAGPVALTGGLGVATSSSERRRWTAPSGARAHHLIDAATGAPGARGTAVVAGGDIVACDVLATCLVLDPALLHDLDLQAARLTAEGRLDVNDLWSQVAA